MIETMNRTARRKAMKGIKTRAKRPGGNAAAGHLYPGIPEIEANHDFCPLKAFAVSLDLMPALGPRLFLDGKNSAQGTINPLDGPASKDAFLLSLPFAKLREFLATQEIRRSKNPIVLDGPGIPPGFTFGLLDIVTYPFWFMLVYPVEREDDQDEGELRRKVWEVNSNLLNRFYPSLRRFAAVLTIIHIDEEPIDDAPVHNIVLWHGPGEGRRLSAPIFMN